MLDFLSVQFPMMKQSLHRDSADEAVQQRQKDVIRAYVRSKTQRN